MLSLSKKFFKEISLSNQRYYKHWQFQLFFNWSRQASFKFFQQSENPPTDLLKQALRTHCFNNLVHYNSTLKIMCSNTSQNKIAMSTESGQKRQDNVAITVEFNLPFVFLNLKCH